MMHFILVLFAVVLANIGHAGGDTAEEKTVLNKVNLGALAGTEILKALGDEKFSKTFKTIGLIAGKLAPFLGAIGPIVSLVSALLPTSDSPQMKLIKDKFADVDSQFDNTLTKFQILQNQIMKASTRKIWAPYEMKIMVMSGFLAQYLNSSNSTTSVFESLVLRQGNDGCINSLEALYTGIMTIPQFGENILTSILQDTEGNRTRSQNEMKRIESLIIRGVSNCIAYYNLKKGNLIASVVQDNWKKKLTEIGNEMKRKDEIAKQEAEKYIRLDIDRKLAEYHKLNDSSFVDKLYNFLSSKYEWKDWFVMALPEFNNEDVMVKYECPETITRWGKHNRNLVVVVVEKDKPYVTNIEKDILDVPLPPDCRTRPSVDCVFKHVPGDIQFGCEMAGLVVFKNYKRENPPIKSSPSPRLFDAKRVYAYQVKGLREFMYIYVHIIGYV